MSKKSQKLELREMDYIKHFKELLESTDAHLTQMEFAIYLMLNCEEDNWDIIKSWTSNSELLKYVNIYEAIEYTLEIVCENGYLDVIENLLTFPNTKQYKSTNIKLNPFLMTACNNEQWDIVKYLLSSPKLKKHADIHYDNDCLLWQASLHGSLDMVQFLIESPELKEHLKPQTNNGTALKAACLSGNLDVVKYLVQSVNGNDDNVDYDAALQASCQKGHLEIVEYLLTSSSLKNKTNIHSDYDNALVEICRNGNLPLINFFLTSPKLTQEQKNYQCIDRAFKVAMESGQIEVVKLLLFNEEFFQLSNRKNNCWATLISSCKIDAVELVQYILEHPKKLEKIDVHSQYDEFFKSICYHKSVNIFNYLVHEFNIPMTADIRRYVNADEGLNKLGKDYVLKQFENRELNKQLKSELLQNQEKRSNTIKI